MIYFCRGFSCCPYYRGVRDVEVFARPELTLLGSSPCHQVTCVPALGSVYKFSRASYRLHFLRSCYQLLRLVTRSHVFPRLGTCTSFPALVSSLIHASFPALVKPVTTGLLYTFSPVYHQLHVFLYSVTYHTFSAVFNG